MGFAIQFEIKGQEEKIQDQRSANKLTTFFFVDEGREDPSNTKGGPTSASSKTPLNGVSLACR